MIMTCPRIFGVGNMEPQENVVFICSTRRSIFWGKMVKGLKMVWQMRLEFVKMERQKTSRSGVSAVHLFFFFLFFYLFGNNLVYLKGVLIGIFEVILQPSNN